MKERNRLFAILLAVMMVFTYMPSMAFAATEDGSEEEPAAVTDVQEEAVEETAQNEPDEAEVQEEEPEAQAEEVREDEAVPVNDADEPERTHGKLVSAKPVIIVPEAKIADNDELFEKYFDVQVDSALEEATKADPSIRTYKAQKAKRKNNLNAVEKYIYSEILKEMQKAASGQTSSTEFSINLSEPLESYIVDSGDEDFPYAITSESLGIQDGVYVQYTNEWDVTSMVFSDEAKEVLFDLEKTVDAVLIDNPYEAYWFDKTAGYMSSFLVQYEDGAESSDIYFGEDGPELVLGFNVAEAYSPENGDQYEIDAEKAASTGDAAEKVQQVIAQNADKGDLDKLYTYKDTICEMTDYNYEAADWNNNVPYGDPWQLIYVFDDDDATKVVCEGYSKAYQYLCDKSTFDNQEIECSTVTGYMDSGTGEEDHMWNILHMDDGRNYIADITNCDVDDQAEGPFPEDLFLKGYASGDIDSGYVYESGEDTISYKYDDSTFKNYDSDELDMSMDDYVDVNVDDSVTGISFTPASEYIDRIENVDGWMGEDGIFTYRWPDFEAGDKLTVSYIDKGDVNYVYDYDESEFIDPTGNSDPIEGYKLNYDYKDEFTELTVNGKYETTVEYMGCEAPGAILRIKPNPVASISFSRDGASKIELIQGKDSDDSWDSEKEEYFDEYELRFEYGDKLTVKYSNNSSAVYEFREVKRDGWYEDAFVNVADDTDTISYGDEARIDADPEQGVDNHWEVGKTYDAVVSYMGREANIKVAIKPNPITDVVYKTYNGSETIKLAENVCGDWIPEDETDDEYFSYDFPGFTEGDSLTVTENGKTSTYVFKESVEGYDSSFVNEDGKKIPEYDLDPMSNQFDPDEWVKGGTGYYYEIKYEGFKFRIPVEIVENPVKTFSFTRNGAGYDEEHPIELVEGVDCEINSDGGKNRYFEYYLTMKNGDVLRLNNTSDYRAIPYSEYDATAKYFENDKGERIRRYDIGQNSDQTFDNQWQPGDEIYKLSLQYSNNQSDINVRIVENPVKNISFVRPGSDTVELIKEGEGSWGGDTFYYEIKFREGDKILVTYAGTSTPVTYVASADADGKVYEFKASGSVPSNGKDVINIDELSYRHNSSYWLDDPETDADSYVMLMYNGKWADVPVSFVDNPVESIEYVWKAGGKEVEIEEGDFGINFAEGDILKVKYAGTDTPVSYVYGVESDSYAFRASGSVPEGAPKVISESEIYQVCDGEGVETWTVGNGYELDLEYLGKTFTVPVKIVEGVLDINDCSVTFDQTYRKLEQIDSTPYDDYFYVVHKGTTLAPIVKKGDVALDSKYYGARYTEVTFNKSANEWQIKDNTKWSATFPEEAGVYLCEVSGSAPYTGVYEDFIDLIRIEDHSWDGGTVTTAASCEKDGVKTYKCTKCSETKEEVIKASGTHSWGKATYNWNSDYTEVTGSHKCSVCGKTETAVAKRASVKVNKPATLTEKGESVYTSEAFTVAGFEVQTITAETPMLPVEDALADANKEIDKASGDVADAEKAAQNSTNEGDVSNAEDSAAKAVELAALAEEAATAAVEDAQKALDNLPANASDEDKAIAQKNLDNANKNLAVAKKLKAAASSTLAKAKSAAAKVASNKAKAVSEAAKNAKDSVEAEKLRKEAEQYAAKAAEKTAAAENASKEAEAAVADLEELAKTVDDPAVKEEVNKTVSEAKTSQKEAATAATAAETSTKEAEKSETAAKEAVDDKKAAEEENFKDHNGTPEVTLSATDFTYKYKVKKVKKKKKAVATVQKPTVQSVTLNGKAINAANYDVTWSNESSGAIGEYSVTVTLKGDYSGKATATYRINPKAVKLKKVKAGKKSFAASWKKLGKNDIKYKAIGGYQLRYATDPDFTDEKIVSGGNLKKTSKTVKKLKKKTTYYVQLRTYKKVSGKYFYSGWSATKKVKIKK